MPDLSQFSITPNGTANVNVPRAIIAAKILDSGSGAVLSDFTGVNALNFPGVLSTLTAAQRLEIAQDVANKILFMKAGLPT